MLIERPKTITTQVSDLLATRIRNQDYAPGDKMPSESDLADQLGVSRATVRTALARLATQGLVLRKQGDGTYVNANLEQVPTRMGGMWDFLRLIENSGFHATIHLRAQKVRPASAAEAAALNLADGAPVLALTRHFCADGQPVILAHTTISAALLVDEGDGLDGELPLSEFVRRYCHKEIAYAIFDIKARMPDADVTAYLQRTPDTPLLLLSQLFYDHSNQPIILSLSDFDEQVISLRLVQTWE